MDIIGEVDADHNDEVSLETPNRENIMPDTFLDAQQFDSSLDEELYTAVAANNIPEVTRLLKNAGNPDAIWRVQPLLSWCGENLGMVKLLLEHGADVNVKNHLDGDRALLSTHNNNLEMTKLLLENKADVNVKDLWGNTPLFGADPEVAQLLLKNGADVNFQNNRQFQIWN